MYQAALGVLRTAANEPIWLDQRPQIFTNTVAAAALTQGETLVAKGSFSYLFFEARK